jgi:hypothetical protein
MGFTSSALTLFQPVIGNNQAAGAYSTRLLRADYAGPLIRVRRSTDNAEVDISPNALADGSGNRWLDTAALVAFAGAGSAFVAVWYDQSGYGRNLIQATAANQPTILSSNAALNGMPALNFSGVSVSLQESASAVSIAQATLSTVYRATILTDTKLAWYKSNLVDLSTFAQSSDNSLRFDGSSRARSIPATSAPYVRTSFRSTSLQTDHINGAQNINVAQALPNIKGVLNVGLAGGGSAFTGALAEFITFEFALSTTDRQTLESNQGTAFGITVA